MRKKNISSIKMIVIVIVFLFAGLTGKSQVLEGAFSNSNADYQAKSPAKPAIIIQQPDAGQLKFRVQVSNPEGKKLCVEVIDRANGRVSSRMTDENMFTITYDFSNAPDGEYLVRVRSGKVKVREKILIQTILKEERIAVFNKTVNNIKAF